MFEISSFRKNLIQQFKEYRIASDRWSHVNDKIMLYFDRHCLECFPEVEGITQEMINSWFIQRETETSRSCYCRTYIIAALVNFLNQRGISNLSVPEPVKADNHRTYIPHAFTDEELSAFFEECDKEVRCAPNQLIAVRRLAVSVFFRLVYPCNAT